MIDISHYSDVYSPSHRWFSVHLYPKATISLHSEAFDAFITGSLQGAIGVGRSAPPFFFVRYADPRAHLRVRVRVPLAVSDVEAMETLGFSSALHSGLVAEALISAYEPEFKRYGGVETMPLVESAFCASSEFVLMRLSTFRDRPRSARVGAGILASYAALKLAFETRESIAEVSRWLRDCWIHLLSSESSTLRECFDVSLRAQLTNVIDYLDEVDDLVERGDGFGVNSQFYQKVWVSLMQACSGVTQQGITSLGTPQPVATLNDRRGLILSLLHMMHNRMGLSRLEEAYAAHAVADACAAVISTSRNA